MLPLIIVFVLVTQASTRVAFADTQSLFNETVVVKNLSFFTITRTIDITGKINVKVQGSVDLVSGGGSISVYVMDADGYQQYQKSREARKSALYSADDVASQTMSVPIAKSGTYHIVLDNEKSLLTSKTVRVQLSLYYETPFLGSPMFFAIVGVAVVAVAVVAAFVFMRSKKKPSGSVPTSKAVGTDAARKNCFSCGALMHEMAKICPACGKQQPT